MDRQGGHAVLLRKILLLPRQSGYGYEVPPPMSTTNARVGDCLGLLQSLVTQATVGHMEESSSRIFTVQFSSLLSTILSTVFHVNIEQQVSHDITHESVPASAAGDLHIAMFLHCGNNRYNMPSPRSAITSDCCLLVGFYTRSLALVADAFHYVRTPISRVPTTFKRLIRPS